MFLYGIFALILTWSILQFLQFGIQLWKLSVFIPADSITFVRLPFFSVIRHFFHKIEHICSKVYSFYFLKLSKPYPDQIFIFSLISYLSCVCEHLHVHPSHLWVWVWVCVSLFVLFIQAGLLIMCFLIVTTVSTIFTETSYALKCIQ